VTYTHPDALRRICEEIENTVWVSDREFFKSHPKRRHRLRPAMSAEISEHEITQGKALECPVGMQLAVVVKLIVPGVRTRWPFFVPAGPAPWDAFSEDYCREWYNSFTLINPDVKQMEADLVALARNGWKR